MLDGLQDNNNNPAHSIVGMVGESEEGFAARLFGSHDLVGALGLLCDLIDVVPRLQGSRLDVDDVHFYAYGRGAYRDNEGWLIGDLPLPLDTSPQVVLANMRP